MARLSLPAKLVLGITATLAVLAVIVALSYHTTERFIAITREAAAARDLRLGLERALAAAQRVEIMQHRYLATGQAGHLDTYRVALEDARAARGWLDSLAGVPGADGPALAVAGRLLDRKLGDIAEAIRAYDSEGPGAAGAVVRAAEARRTLDSLRATVLAMEAGQTSRLTRLDRAARQAAGRTLAGVAVLAAAAVALFGAVCLLLWRTIQAGRRREEALEGERAALDARVREQTAEVRRLNADLAERVAELETLFAVIPMGIGVAYDAECRDVRVNPAFGRMLRLSPDQNASKSGPEAGQLPFRCMTYDGEEIPPEDLVMQRAARTGLPVNNEAYRVVYADGSAIDLLGSAAPLFDEHGRVRGAVGAFADVSERRRTDEQIQHAQRLQAVGQLAGGVAHEINNLMTAVLGFAEFAQRGVGPQHPVSRDLREVLAGASRAAEVAQQLLAFSRRRPVRPRVLRPDGILEELRPTLERLVGANVRLVLRPGAGGAQVRGDPGQLQQVLINLAANARDAMPEGGEVEIETRAVENGAAGDGMGGGPEIAPGRYLVVVVNDSGSGMDAETRRRAFEPFFTTKPVGSGTGLGLSIVYGIIKQAGGEVRLTSEPGRGTRVEVYLPIVEEAEGPPPHPAPAREVPGGRILLVEDDAAVRALAERSLRAAGHEVVAVGDGRQAIAVLEQEGRSLDLVVTDMVMPHLGGRAVGRLVAERYPWIGVLYISGYVRDTVMGQGALDEETDFLAKPFTPEELVSRVRARLDLIRRPPPDGPSPDTRPASSPGASGAPVP